MKTRALLSGLLFGSLLALEGCGAGQYNIPNVGCLDLLCIDETGTLVVVEFKRDSTNRETIAQILDYASWLDTATEEQIEACAVKYFDKSLADAFAECFGDELQSLTPQNHRMLVVAPKLDSSAERIINYLAERHGMNINAVFFRYAKTARGDEILIRTVLVPDALHKATSRRDSTTTTELLNMANEYKIAHLVDVCRTLSIDAQEQAVDTYGGSFRYWFKRRMIVGVNVAGKRRSPPPPPGELDVWIQVPRLSEVVAVPEEVIRESLKSDFYATPIGASDYVIRLKTAELAQALVSVIKGWVVSASLQSQPTES